MPFAGAGGILAIHTVRDNSVLRNFTVYMCIAGHVINSGNEMDHTLFRLELYVHLPLQTVDLNGIHIFFIDMQLIVKPFVDLLSHNFLIGFVRTTQRNIFPFTLALVQLWRLYTVNQIEVALTLSDLHSRHALAARRHSKSSASEAVRARLDVMDTLKNGFHLNDTRTKLQSLGHWETQRASDTKTNRLTLLRKELQYCVAIIGNT